ncbi:hypothetical protein BC938DRAFT_475334 [Jimgerdemannia flammicorona]|uniref:Uncharacterized protein n=1 Tax=Jimgerdemannia flammicorona TaxID=994334 RepID=A0A433PWL6_9FUNG|nr:hypothetical protein BC938DRAFT_475334 [Jimgerdemannia flammicorona]
MSGSPTYTSPHQVPKHSPSPPGYTYDSDQSCDSQRTISSKPLSSNGSSFPMRRSRSQSGSRSRSRSFDRRYRSRQSRNHRYQSLSQSRSRSRSTRRRSPLRSLMRRHGGRRLRSQSQSRSRSTDSDSSSGKSSGSDSELGSRSRKSSNSRKSSSSDKDTGSDTDSDSGSESAYARCSSDWSRSRSPELRWRRNKYLNRNKPKSVSRSYYHAKKRRLRYSPRFSSPCDRNRRQNRYRTPLRCCNRHQRRPRSPMRRRDLDFSDRTDSRSSVASHGIHMRTPTSPIVIHTSVVNVHSHLNDRNDTVPKAQARLPFVMHEVNMFRVLNAAIEIARKNLCGLIAKRMQRHGGLAIVKDFCECYYNCNVAGPWEFISENTLAEWPIDAQLRLAIKAFDVFWSEIWYLNSAMEVLLKFPDCTVNRPAHKISLSFTRFPKDDKLVFQRLMQLRDTNFMFNGDGTVNHAGLYRMFGEIERVIQLGGGGHEDKRDLDELAELVRLDSYASVAHRPTPLATVNPQMLLDRAYKSRKQRWNAQLEVAVRDIEQVHDGGSAHNTYGVGPVEMRGSDEML